MIWVEIQWPRRLQRPKYLDWCDGFTMQAIATRCATAMWCLQPRATVLATPGGLCAPLLRHIFPATGGGHCHRCPPQLDAPGHTRVIERASHATYDYQIAKNCLSMLYQLIVYIQGMRCFSKHQLHFRKSAPPNPTIPSLELRNSLVQKMS